MTATSRPVSQGPAVLWTRLGGPLGRHARGGMSFLRGPGLLFLIGTLSWFVLMARQSVCRQSDAGHPVNSFYRLCYSDIPVLYQVRGIAEGQPLYSEVPWEYPVLTGGFVEVARLVTNLLGFRAQPGLDGQQVLDNANVFFAVSSVMLFACFLATIDLTRRMMPSDGWRAGLMVAVSPVVMAEALINWDMFAVALTAAAMYAWMKKHPFVSGLLYGLAIAAKLYPLFILGPLVLLLIRAGKLDAMSRLLAGTTASWLAVNLPVYLATPSGWAYFFTFNADRGGDLGSIWYVLALGGIQVPNVSMWSLLFMLAGCVGLGLLCFVAPRRPRVAQVAFIVVALFLIVNKVYSPQYALWLLPLLVLARPDWRSWAVWTVAELIYFAAIWGHLAGTLKPGSGGPDRIYWLAVFIRVGVQLWLVLVVATDILRPDEDPVRETGTDDEIGGVLDGAPDQFALVPVGAGTVRTGSSKPPAPATRRERRGRPGR